jgi:hypothetical protein
MFNYLVIINNYNHIIKSLNYIKYQDTYNVLYC